MLIILQLVVDHSFSLTSMNVHGRSLKDITKWSLASVPRYIYFLTRNAEMYSSVFDDSHYFLQSLWQPTHFTCGNIWLIQKCAVSAYP